MASAVTTSPASEYRRRHDAWRVRRGRLERRSRRLVRVRNRVLGLIIALFVLADKETVAVKIVLILPPALVLEGVDRWRRATRRAVEVAGRAENLYEGRLACLDGDAAGRGPDGARFLDDDHPYAADLDLFGRGSVFELMCLARTGAGEETLAAWLREPAEPDEVRRRQAVVADLRDALDLREALALLDPPRRAAVDVAALRAWAKTPVAFPAWSRPVGLLLVAAMLAALAGALFFATGLLPFLGALALEAAFARHLRGMVQQSLQPIEGRADDLALLAEVRRRRERGSLASRRLARLARLARRLEVKNALPQAPLASALLWTTHVALSVESWRKRWGMSLDAWLTTSGAFEALLSLARHAYENPGDPFPELVAGGPLFEAEGLRHPLLPPARCVPNDVRLDGATSLLVVSGSNMSGKSTLLRAAGVNAVLAQAGAPVRATRLRLSPLAVGSTLRVRDSLRDGRSRFYVEVVRVRQLIAAAHGPRPLLFLLDELFAGTNADDRRRGAEAVARALVEAGAVGFLTTHDLALTHLVDRLAPRAVNVHFADRADGADLVFDYRMRPGVAPHGNALAILRAAGFAV